MDSSRIIEILDTVIDPETGVGLVTSKRIQNLTHDGKNINFDLEAGDLDPMIKGELNLAIVELLAKEFPDIEVNVNMISSDNRGDQNNAGKTISGKNPLPHVKNVIAIASGKGGVGKSSVAVNLALSLKELGYKVGLLDGDMYGPSIPTMLQLQGKRPGLKRVYNVDKLLPIEAYGIFAMSIGFFVDPDQAVILRGPKLDSVLRQFVKDVVWPELDFMIIDLPPGTGDVQLSLVQLLPVTGVIMVTTPQQVALDDAVKALNMFMLDNIEVPVLGVVENMSWFVVDELPDKKFYIFGKGGGQILADKGQTDLLAQIPIVESIREAGDDGKPVILSDEKVREYYIQLARNVESRTKIRNEVLNPTKIVHRT
jgi:ATP-binding protein involved in chromosome partitioning